MFNKYIVRFWFDEKDSIQVPIKALDNQIVSNKIIEAFKEERYISFPTKDGIRKFECTTVFLNQVRYFQIEKPTRSMLEKYVEEDFITL